MVNEHRRREFVAVAVCFTVLAFAGLVARLVSRRMKRVRLAFDDFLLIASMVFCVGENAMLANSAAKGRTGQHIAEMSMENIQAFQKELFASGVILPTCLALAKISLLLLYHRLFSVTSFRIINYGLIAMVSVWYIIILFMTIFLCTPIASNWDLTVKGKCLDRWDLNRAAPVPWVVTDFAVLLAPLPWLKRLNIRHAEKVALIGLFLLGSFTCIVSAIRYGQLWLIKEDATYDIYNLGILSTIEASVTVLCTALIASKPAIVAVIPKSWQKRFKDYLATHSRSVSSWTPNVFHALPKHNGTGDSSTLVKVDSGSAGKSSGERTLASRPSQLQFVTSAEMPDERHTAERAV